MDPRIRHMLLVRVLFNAVPELRRMLQHHELDSNLRDPELVARLAGFLDPLLEVRLRNIRPIPRHEECLDCDTNRSSHLQFGDGEWHTHCDVCMEPWPCPEAGLPDVDAVESVKANIEALLAKPDRSTEDDYNLWTQQRRLETSFTEPSKT